jgi:regulator of protease activity HflC (stomatin/prohibitin superfamily)
MSALFGMLIGFIAWFVLRYILTSFYTVDQNERAVKTVFGRAERVGTATTIESPMGETLTEEQKQRYNYPQVRVIPPGGPYLALGKDLQSLDCHADDQHGPGSR